MSNNIKSRKVAKYDIKERRVQSHLSLSYIKSLDGF